MKKLNEILELIVFKHSVFALPFLLVSMLEASKFSPLEIGQIARLFALAICCAVAARSFAMALNRYADARFDAQNLRTANRLSANGSINKSFLLGFIVVCALVFVVLSYFINDICFALSLPTLALLASYSYFKRFSEFAHVVLGLCLGFACIAGELIISAQVSAMSLSLCFAVCFWTAGFDVLYALQDEEFDKKMGLFSIPARYGASAARFISRIFHLASALFFVLFAAICELGFWGQCAVVASIILLVLEQIFAARNQIERAFFTTNAALSLVFLAFYLIDWIANAI